ncbi:beta-ketoacyl synthase N-terminal-like domain-containing protein [Maridesulfovibrio sp.]|uniref:type I polyketide synthase n=1 Tax=Maridesulfovibrio sp. TaxID=2795000 RepID=UPI003BACAC4A
MKKIYDYTDSCIAVIGMAARFPGAENIDRFWENLQAGRQSMTTLDESDLEQSIHAAYSKDPQYVPKCSAINGYEYFDADFFGISPHEAAITDPQQRLLLEYGWKAFENAGHVPADTQETITGVYASCSMSSYLLSNLYGHVMAGRLDMTEALLGNDKDYPATRLAYKLGLRGPAMTVQTACSSSLSSLHVACQSLLAGECDRALVASATLLGEPLGYMYLEGGMRSPDGCCRPYDAEGKGTIFGSGVATVLLKRLADAQEDNDHIMAVIRSTAINNDGNDKVGFTAPSVNAQAAVIAEALHLSGIDPWDMDFIEGHGTATPMGDPIEVAALHQAYVETAQNSSPAGHSILLGSVKSNIGHLDATAGLAGFIKTVLSLHHGYVPGTANFKQHNPLFGASMAPFEVRSTRTPLPEESNARLGSVSAFGVGGTNVHAVLQGPPQQPEPQNEHKDAHLFLLSGHDTTGLFRTQENLAEHLELSKDVPQDIAHTLLHGRAKLPARRAVVAATIEEARVALLNKLSPPRLVAQGEKRKTAFIFSGQGSQHPEMGRRLYKNEPEFKTLFDHTAALIQKHCGPDLNALMKACWNKDKTAAEHITSTEVTQPLLFTLEYSLARLLMKNGLEPEYLLGHSIGEYSAACLAGVFSEEDAAKLVVARGKLMQMAPAGKMLALTIGEESLSMLPSALRNAVEVAVVNTSQTCVISGHEHDLLACASTLNEAGEHATMLKTSHAFHSSFMDGVLDSFRNVLQTVPMQAPQIPVVSNLTGTWAGEKMGTPEYWVSQLRNTVRFSDCLQTLFAQPCIGVEIGPGKVLCTFASQEMEAEGIAVPALGGRGEDESGSILEILGKVWVSGGSPDWDNCPAIKTGSKIPLPGYAFERQKHWIESMHSDVIATPQFLPAEDIQKEAPAQTYGGIRKQPRPNPDSYVAPSTTQEMLLATIWEDLLLIEPVGTQDNFIELGGNSMHVLRMVRMAADHGMTFSIKDVFKAKTIAALCNIIAENQELSAPEDTAGAKPNSQKDSSNFDESEISQTDLEAIFAATGVYQ